MTQSGVTINRKFSYTSEGRFGENVFDYGHVEVYLFFGICSVFLSGPMTRGRASKLAILRAALPRSVPFSFSDITIGGLCVCETRPAACSCASQCNPPAPSAIRRSIQIRLRPWEEGFLISSETLAVTGNRPTGLRASPSKLMCAPLDFSQ